MDNNNLKDKKDNLIGDLGLNSVNSVGIRADGQGMREISGKILGIDYGEKNVGLAISDREQNQAFVYDTIQMGKNFWDKLEEIIEQEKPDRIIVGLPLGLNGEYTKKTEEVVIFIEELENNLKLPVETEDERLSSVEADKLNSGNGRDEEAARIILQSYLDKTLARITP
jgi:putative holliday junction resolvase